MKDAHFKDSLAFLFSFRLVVGLRFESWKLEDGKNRNANARVVALHFTSKYRSVSAIKSYRFSHAAIGICRKDRSQLGFRKRELVRPELPFPEAAEGSSLFRHRSCFAS